MVSEKLHDFPGASKSLTNTERCTKIIQMMIFTVFDPFQTSPLTYKTASDNILYFGDIIT